MSTLKKQERAALEAVVRHFSATWEEGEGPSDAYLTIARKRIAVEVATLKPRIADPGGFTPPRLRFDRVALGLVRRLQAALGESVPDGKTLILTITAPIRLPAKTAAALEEKIRTALARRPAPMEARHTIHGNRIRARLVKGGVMGGSARTAKVIGFVHNPDSDPDVVLGITQSLIEGIGAKARQGAPAAFAGERWLVLAGEDRLSDVRPYRHVCSQLSLPTEFEKILMVLAGERIESLSG
jgi:hypothetical protein